MSPVTAKARKPAAKKPAAKAKAAKRPVARKKAVAKPAAKTQFKAKKRVAAKPAAKKAVATKPAAKASVAARAAPRRASARKFVAPSNLVDFMAQAWEMEIEAAQRYTDFADSMEMHNNREVAAMFRTMANYETKHADEIMATMGWSESPPVTARSGGWPGYEAPETPGIDDVHYLMRPWHALQLALAAEQRAERFFAELVRVATDSAVREAARALQAEEQEHVRLVLEWMKKVPQPDKDWAVDPDPPRYTD
jgi:rubrerythrin